MLTPSQYYWQQVRTYTLGGKTFRCSRRTAAHIRDTQRRLTQNYGAGHHLRIIQGCYNTTIAASAGTHDYDCVIDLEVVGFGWDRGEKFMRNCGWAAWHRTKAQGFSGDHLHAISLPPNWDNTPTITQVQQSFKARGLEVGAWVPGQVDDYYAHALRTLWCRCGSPPRSPSGFAQS